MMQFSLKHLLFIVTLVAVFCGSVKCDPTFVFFSGFGVLYLCVGFAFIGIRNDNPKVIERSLTGMVFGIVLLVASMINTYSLIFSVK